MRRNPSGTLMRILSIEAASRFVIGVDVFAIVILRECTFADPPNLSFRRAMLDKVEGFDFDKTTIAGSHECDVARENMDFSLQTEHCAGIRVNSELPSFKTEPADSLATVSTTDGSDAVRRTRSCFFSAFSSWAAAVSRSPRAFTSS